MSFVPRPVVCGSQHFSSRSPLLIPKMGNAGGRGIANAGVRYIFLRLSQPAAEGKATCRGNAACRTRFFLDGRPGGALQAHGGGNPSMSFSSEPLPPPRVPPAPPAKGVSVTTLILSLALAVFVTA